MSKIVVVDSSPEIVNFYRDLEIPYAQYSSMSYEEAQRALERKELKADLFIIDLVEKNKKGMLLVSGLHLLKKIRAAGFEKRVPIIVTDSDRVLLDTKEEKALGEGADFYFRKPFSDLDLLIKTIERMLHTNE